MNILSRQVLNRKEFEPRLDHWYLVLGVRPNRERVIQPFEIELNANMTLEECDREAYGIIVTELLKNTELGIIGIYETKERMPFELGKTTVTGQARKLYDLEDDFSEDIEGVALQIAATARAGLAH